MAKSRFIAWKLDASGQYSRQVGWKAGQSGQTKFPLGSDLAKAKLTAQKLAMLWDVVAQEHARAVKFQEDDFTQPAHAASRAVWTADTLALAEAIRKHQHVIKVSQPGHVEGPLAYVAYIAHLRQRFGHLIQIQPMDSEAAQEGKRHHQHAAVHRTRHARLNTRIAQIPLPTVESGSTLYEAIDAYAAHAQWVTKRESGQVESATALRLKDSTRGIDLAEFGYSAMERMHP